MGRALKVVNAANVVDKYVGEIRLASIVGLCSSERGLRRLLQRLNMGIK